MRRWRQRPTMAALAKRSHRAGAGCSSRPPTKCCAQRPPPDRNVTFVDPGAWLGNANAEHSAEKTMRIIVETFLGANGPATIGDFADGSGLIRRPARAT